MLRKPFILIAAAVLCGFSGCGSSGSVDNSASKTEPETETVVYTVGDYKNSLSKTVACYWRNAVKTDLESSTDNSSAISVHADGNEIYMCGYLIPAGGEQTACYWHNGVRTDLGKGIAYGIFMNGTDVYVAGGGTSTGTQIACYWRNGVKTDLASTYSSATGIIVEGTTVYTAGWYDNGSTRVYCYWVNGSITELAGGSFASDGCMDVDDGDVYLGGHYTSGYVFIPCFWKNGARTALPAVAFSQDVYAIDIQGDSVYAAGYVKDASLTFNACVWRNGIRTDITNDARINDMIKHGDDLYAGGYTGSVSYPVACYWENESITMLGTGLAESRVRSIAVVEE